MKQILVLIENELEQSITGDILRSGLGAEAEITPHSRGGAGHPAASRAERWISSLRMLNGLTWPTAIWLPRRERRPPTPDPGLHRWGRRGGNRRGMSGASASGIICSSRTGPRGCWPRCAPWCVRRRRSVGVSPTSRRFYLRRLTEHLQRFQYKKCTDAAKRIP